MSPRGTGTVLGTSFWTYFIYLTIRTALLYTYTTLYLRESTVISLSTYSTNSSFVSIGFIPSLMTFRVFVSIVMVGFLHVTGTILISSTIFFYFLMTVLVSFDVFGTILTREIIFFLGTNFILLTVFLYGLRTSCFFVRVCTVHDVTNLLRFFSSACTWQYL